MRPIFHLECGKNLVNNSFKLNLKDRTTIVTQQLHFVLQPWNYSFVDEQLL